VAKSLEEKLAEFKVNSKVVNVLKGPVVDTFELELGFGVKISRVTSMTEDLSLALQGVPIRVVYPMEGKSTLGVEVPRLPREIIYVSEILFGHSFKENKARIPIVLGKNTFGNPTIVDLVKMPHMLVAGATGAGKSVFINSFLVSMLTKLAPRQLRLILIDPKQLELAPYSKIEHLLVPVITDPGRASAALLWACEEMERRYKILSDSGVRNLESFNEKVQEFDQIPYIVIIIDEFADLILSKSGKEIENSVCRIAAKARASGIHLVLATSINLSNSKYKNLPHLLQTALRHQGVFLLLRKNQTNLCCVR
jgi:S-DNA-T family DNA segregation ATPase FtsK/SpoIIIE